MIPRPTRLLPNFIDGWLSLTKDLPASEFLRLWSGIFTVSAALTRRVWLKTKPTFPPLAPNLFLLLVGDPGVGKDIAMGPIRSLFHAALEDMPPDIGVNLGPKSVSGKGILDALAHETAILRIGGKTNGGFQDFHSLILCTPELGTLLPEYDARLTSILCDLYNCDDHFSEQIRNGKGEPLVLEFPHVSLIAGTQPTFLFSNFPEEAFGMGLFSRMILLFEEKATKVPFFHEGGDAAKIYEEQAEEYANLQNKLSSDLRAVIQLRGAFKPTNDYRRLTNRFIEEEEETGVAGSRFDHYNTRRSLQLQKLAMCHSAASGNSLNLTETHWHAALTCLTDAEKRMPKVFANVATNKGFHTTVEEILDTKSAFISHQKLERQLRRKHAAGEVGLILRNMISAGDIVQEKEEKGFPIYRIKHKR